MVVRIWEGEGKILAKASMSSALRVAKESERAAVANVRVEMLCTAGVRRGVAILCGLVLSARGEDNRATVSPFRETSWVTRRPAARLPELIANIV